MTVEWHLIVDNVGRSGAINMAIDYTLLLEARQGHAFLRLYRWEPACLSFGRNEPALKRYDRDLIEKRGLDTVRRPTGGRAVWHEHEVTYAVAAPDTLFGTLRETYWTIHRTLAAALTDMGAQVGQAGAPHKAATLSGGACFSSPVGGEVVANGRKLIGSAQFRKDGAFLQHGSILLQGRQDIISQVSRSGDSASTGATSISEVLGRPVTFAQTTEAIAAQARADWRGTWHSPVSSRIPSSCFSFDDSAWTWRR